MNIFQTQMDLSNEVKQLSPVKLPRYDVEGEKIQVRKYTYARYLTLNP